VDCFREGRPPAEAGAKAKNSAYCKFHGYQRQKNSKGVTSNRKQLIHGKWSDISNSIETLVRQQEIAIRRVFQENDAWGEPVQIAIHRPYANSVAFEHECVRMALGAGRRISIDEEDLAIEAYNGSRTGFDALTATIGASLVVPTGPVLLPNPKIRERFRAEEKGGPTTVGEPSFTTYYERFYEKPVPNDLKEDLDPNEEVMASDGLVVPRKMLEGYELHLKREQHKAGKETKFNESKFEDPEDNYGDRMKDIP
jgi:hypothetical protein